VLNDAREMRNVCARARALITGTVASVAGDRVAAKVGKCLYSAYPFEEYISHGASPRSNARALHFTTVLSLYKTRSRS